MRELRASAGSLISSPRLPCLYPLSSGFWSGSQIQFLCSIVHVKSSFPGSRAVDELTPKLIPEVLQCSESETDWAQWACRVSSVPRIHSLSSLVPGLALTSPGYPDILSGCVFVPTAWLMVPGPTTWHLQILPVFPALLPPCLSHSGSFSVSSASSHQPSPDTDEKCMWTEGSVWPSLALCPDFEIPQTPADLWVSAHLPWVGHVQPHCSNQSTREWCQAGCG